MNKLAYVLRGIFPRLRVLGSSEIDHVELTSSTTPSKLNSLSSNAALNSTPTAGSITYVNDLSKGIYYADGTQWLALMGSAGGTMVISGDGTAPATTSNLVLTLASTGVAAGSYTLASVTVDAKGRVTSIVSGSAGTVTSVNATGSNGIVVSGVPFTTSGTIALSLGAITPSSVNASGTIVGSNLSGTNTGNQTISLTGDVTGSGTSSFAATLANTAVAAGSYTLANITVDGKGRITSASSGSAGTVTSVSGTAPIVSSGGTTPAISLANTAVTVGSYTNANITVDAQGRLTSASNGSAGSSGTVTSVSVTTANGVSGSVATATTTPAITLTLGAITPTDVTASGNMSSTSLAVSSGITTGTLLAFSTITAGGTITGSNLSGTNTGNQTITLTGDVTGSGTGSFVATLVTVPVTKGGTGATTLSGYLKGNGALAFTASATIPATDLSGTIASARLSGAYTGITGLGTLGALTVSGTSVVTGSSVVDGSTSGFVICRRDTSAQAWQWYSDTGNFQLYDHSASTDRLTITSAGLSVAGTIAATGAISGSSLSGTLPATNLSGTIANARLDSTVVILAYGQTLTNKRITPRSGVTTGVSSTLTFNTDSNDVIEVGTLTSNVALISITGTPTDGQVIRLSFTQDGTGGRTISWPAGVAFGTDYTAAMVPTAANSKWQMTLTYNSAGSVWRVTGMARGF